MPEIQQRDSGELQLSAGKMMATVTARDALVAELGTRLSWLGHSYSLGTPALMVGVQSAVQCAVAAGLQRTLPQDMNERTWKHHLALVGGLAAGTAGAYYLGNAILGACGADPIGFSDLLAITAVGKATRFLATAVLSDCMHKSKEAQLAEQQKLLMEHFLSAVQEQQLPNEGEKGVALQTLDSPTYSDLSENSEESLALRDALSA